MIDGNRLLAFRQMGGDVPVRGANLRILVSPTGAVVSIKAYLLRDPPVEPINLPDEDEMRFRIEEEQGVKVHTLERQRVFPTTDRKSMRPAWCAVVEYPDTEISETFVDHEGAKIADRPLSLGLGVCNHNEWEYTAFGTVSGFSPAPDDIYTTSAGSTFDNFYSLPGIVVRSHEGKSDLTNQKGEFDFSVTSKRGIIWPEITFGECEGAGIKPIFSVIRSERDCDRNLPIIELDPITKDVENGFEFRLNEIKLHQYNFELMAYHHVRKFYISSTEILKNNGLPYEDFFPLKVVTPNLPPPGAYPRYTPFEKESKICLPRMKDFSNWYTATAIHHEYGHHVIHTITRSNEGSPVIDGVADALTAFHNDNYRLGYLSELDPGSMGFSLEHSVDEIVQRRILRDRATVGKIFWSIYSRFEAKDEAKILVYRWLATLAGSVNPERAFELSYTMMEELLDADDMVGDHMFDRADGNRSNGTPHSFHIIATFNELMSEGSSMRFLRGDANSSGDVDLSDGVTTLNHLFLGATWPDCLQAADTDASGAVDISDPIYILNFLFLGGPKPPFPFPECGTSEENKLWCKKPSCIED